MGQFSWRTQDTDVPIWNDWDKYGDQQTIHMVDPRDGTDYKEEAYEGYGVFGGRDFYDLFAEINLKQILSITPEKEKESLSKLFQKNYKKCNDDEIRERRLKGINLWFSTFEGSGVIRKIQDSEFINSLRSPVLVENYKDWKIYSGPGRFPESHEYQGWHNEEDCPELKEDE